MRKIGMLLVLVVASGLIGTAAAAELANETVRFEGENETADVEIVWNSSISDPANSSATVTWYNETEYQNDPANATVVLENEYLADPGNVTAATYEPGTELQNATDYRFVVSATDGHVDDATISISAPGGGGFFSSGTSEKKIAVVVLLAAAVIGFARGDE